MPVVSVPVEFWGHVYPHGKFEVNYNPVTKSWNYTFRSAQQGDTPFCDWIDDNFKPNYKSSDEQVRYITIIRSLVFKNNVPVKMEFGLEKCLVIPKELQDAVNSWKYWTNEPEPDTSAYYKQINLDTEKWQHDDAKIKTKGTFFD